MTRKGYAKEIDANPFEIEEGFKDVGEEGRFFGPEDVTGDEMQDIDEDGTAQTAPEGDDIESVKSELECLRKQSADDREQLLRVSAEFENYKKRSQRHMEDFKKYANEALLKELLTVVDNLERAISSSGGISSGSPDSGSTVSLKARLRSAWHTIQVPPLSRKPESFPPARRA